MVDCNNDRGGSRILRREGLKVARAKHASIFKNIAHYYSL